MQALCMVHGTYRDLVGRALENLSRKSSFTCALCAAGWGIPGKLDKCETIQLEQSNLGNHDWELTSMKLILKGKALTTLKANARSADPAFEKLGKTLKWVHLPKLDRSFVSLAYVLSGRSI
jgi:hypothetical protein